MSYRQTLEKIKIYSGIVEDSDGVHVLGEYIRRLPEEYQVRIRSDVNNRLIKGPFGAMLTLLLDNPYPDYSTVLSQCKQVSARPLYGNGRRYQNTRVLKDPNIRREVLKYLLTGKTDIGKGVIRMAIVNDRDELRQLVQIEGGLSERGARRLISERYKPIM